MCVPRQSLFSIAVPASSGISGSMISDIRIPQGRQHIGIRKSSLPVIGCSPPNTPNKKRSRSQCGSFDLTDLVHASQQVEDSIAFPVVRWPTLEGDDEGIDDDSASRIIPSDSTDVDDEDEDGEYFTPMRKRHCRGLKRCQRSYDLSSMVDMMVSSPTAERRGSAGSFA